MTQNNAQKAIVIGGGFGGIAAALRLRAKGYDVTLIDKQKNLGGRAQVYHHEGFTHDAGPTVITAAFLIQELFELFNKNIKNYIQFMPVDPWYRFIFSDGNYFNYGSSTEATLAEIARFNPKDQAGYLKLLDASKKLFNLGFEKYATKSFHHVSSMLEALPHLVRLKSHQSVWQFVSRYIRDDRLRRAFSIQPLLIGGNPFDTSCIYSLIHYLERKWGVFFPQGGTGALVDGLKKLLTEMQVTLLLDKTVEKISVQNKKVEGVLLTDGNYLPAKLVVSNADPAYCYNHMIDKCQQSYQTRFKTRHAKFSMGLFLFYFGTKRAYANVAQHTIYLGESYQSLLNDIFHKKILSEDISFYLHRPAATDPNFASEHHDTFYALVPVPNLQAKLCWQDAADILKENIIRKLSSSILPDLKTNIVADFYKTPEDFSANYLSLHGAGFSIAPLLRQSAWLRYHNKAEKISGLYHVGAGTHPGAGLPGVLCSAKVIDHLIPYAT